MAADLANKAFSHSVTTADSTTLFITDEDPFTYNTTMSCYTADCFLGIMIDTRASKCFTTGYGQFLAF